MGYLFTGFIFLSLAAVIFTLYELAPGRIKREINELIEQIGG